MASFTSTPTPGFYYDENTLRNISPTALFQQGVSNVDRGLVLERGVSMGWSSDPTPTWLAYDCQIKVLLDAGLALHRPLPQSDPPPDTLATCTVSPLQDNIQAVNDGVNTISRGNWSDSVQRMANSDYRFVLYGYGVRYGYKVPIPGIKTIAGVPAIPDAYQEASNRIIGNWCGVPVWMGRWELWYMVSLPPKAQQLAPPNIASYLADGAVAGTIQAPFSQPDSNFLKDGPNLPAGWNGLQVQPNLPGFLTT